MSFIPRPTLGGISKRALTTMSGFKAFILRGNIIDLAVGIVIGTAFTALVTALVTDVITPLIPIPGKNTLGTWTVPLPSPYAPGTVVHIGAFINTIISFLILAAVLYFFVVRPVSAFMDRYKPQVVEVPVVNRDCPYCLQSVPLQATRCAFCTSPLPPAAPQDAPA
jgi:large conductance mechanosensitive channel